MLPLDPEYLAELSRQYGALSAFLGGFAATFLGTLLVGERTHRVVGLAAGAAAVSAAAFILSVVGATTLAAVLHPAAPRALAAGAPVLLARAALVLGFTVGVYALLASLGLSGWTRSRRLGWLTTAVSIAAAAVVTVLTIAVG